MRAWRRLICKFKDHDWTSKVIEDEVNSSNIDDYSPQEAMTLYCRRCGCIDDWSLRLLLRPIEFTEEELKRIKENLNPDDLQVRYKRT
jgi:hypothetical protein